MTAIVRPDMDIGSNGHQPREDHRHGEAWQKDSAGKAAGAEVEGSSQRLRQLVELLVNVRGGLRDLAIGARLQVLEAMLEDDREAHCPPMRRLIMRSRSTTIDNTSRSVLEHLLFR